MSEFSKKLLDLDFESDPFRPSPDHAGNWFCHRSDVLWMSSIGADAARTQAHELAHFILHAATPYGVFLDILADFQKHHVVQYCDYLCDIGPIYVPICAFARKLDRLANACKLPNSSTYSKAIDEHILPWHRTKFLESILEGSFLPWVLECNEGEPIRILQKVEEELAAFHIAHDRPVFCSSDITRVRSLLVKGVPMAERLPNLLDISEVRACPPISLGRFSSALGARAIFEGHAFVAQYGYDPKMIEHLGATDRSLHYLGTVLCVIHKLGMNIDSREAYDDVHRTLVAVSDLALFTPIGPVYGHLRSRYSDWGDVHPGYRFSAALNFVTEQKLSLTDGGDEAYAKFQAIVSEALGWVDPTRFYEVGASLEHPDLRRHKKACVLRLSGLNLFREESLQDERYAEALRDLMLMDMPLMYVPAIHSHALVIAEDIQTALQKIMRHVLALLTHQMMIEGRVDILSCFPSKLDYSGFCSNIESHEEMLALMQRFLKWLKQERFEPLSNLECGERRKSLLSLLCFWRKGKSC